jgi:non-heme chloroperoxidase
MMAVVTNDNISISVQTQGQGRPLVLLHGWSGSSRYFMLNEKSLAQHCKVITYDQRFHGESGKPEHGFHVARLAADLHDVLEHLGIEKAVLLGTSMVRCMPKLVSNSEESALI